MSRRNFFRLTLSLLNVKKSFFENQKIGLRFSIVDQNATDAPQFKSLDITKSVNEPRGTPAVAAEHAYKPSY